MFGASVGFSPTLGQETFTIPFGNLFPAIAGPSAPLPWQMIAGRRLVCRFEDPVLPPAEIVAPPPATVHFVRTGWF